MPARTSRHINYDLFHRRRIRADRVVKAGLIYVMQATSFFPR